MCETVRQSEPGACSICLMDLVLLDPIGGGADSAALGPRAPGEREATPTALMPGVPDGLFYSAALASLLLSFVLFEVWGRRTRTTGGTTPRA